MIAVLSDARSPGLVPQGMQGAKWLVPVVFKYSRQRREGQGYALQAFVIDWEAQQARCLQGHASVHWRPGHDVSGDPVIRIRFDGATCRACPARPACTASKDAPRQLTVRLQAHHESL